MPFHAPVYALASSSLQGVVGQVAVGRDEPVDAAVVPDGAMTRQVREGQSARITQLRAVGELSRRDQLREGRRTHDLPAVQRAICPVDSDVDLYHSSHAKVELLAA